MRQEAEQLQIIYALFLSGLTDKFKDMFSIQKPAALELSKQVLLAAFLLFATFLVFWKVESFKFIDFDDQKYISTNPYLYEGLTPRAIKSIFTAGISNQDFPLDYWRPLTFLSHLIDLEFFGRNPSAHHLVNLFLHITNVLILFFLLVDATNSRWKSFFAALVFAIHPVQAEPIAWLSARKDLLSGFFILLSLTAYTDSKRHSSRIAYFLSLFLYLCAMLSKPVPMFPFYLLLWDIWPLNGNHQTIKSTVKLLAEKIPFFIFSLLILPSLFSPALHGTSFVKLDIPHIVFSYVHYVRSLFLPLNLGIYGPSIEPLFHPIVLWLGAILLGLISIMTIGYKKACSFLFVGWFWFILGLLPLSMGEYPADRFLYLPIIGLSIFFSWGISTFISHHPQSKAAIFIIPVVFFTSLANITFHQLDHWRNTKSVFERAVTVNPHNFVAQNNIGSFLFSEGRTDESIPYFRKSFLINPHYDLAVLNLGLALNKQGKTEEAVFYLNKAISLNPKLAGAYYHLGNISLKMIRFEEAARYFEKALSINPRFSEAQNALIFAQDQLSPADGPR